MKFLEFFFNKQQQQQQQQQQNSTKLNTNNLNINSLSNKPDILNNNAVECISIPINSKNISACMFLHTFYYL